MKSQQTDMKTGNWFKDLRNRLRNEDKEKPKIPFDKTSWAKAVMLVYYAVVMMAMYKIAYTTIIQSESVSEISEVGLIALKIGLTGIFIFFLVDVFILTRKHVRITRKRFIFIRRMKRKAKLVKLANPYEAFDDVPIGKGRK